MQDKFTAYVRTYAPIVVGALISFLATKNITVDETFRGNLVIAFTALVQGVYYLAARLVGKKWPKVEALLLGSSKTPEYKG